MSNFKESLFWILWTFRLAGLTVFEMPENVFWPKFTASYIIVLGLCYSYTMWLKLSMSIESVEMVPLVTVVFNIVLFCNIIVALVSFILSWYRRKYRLEFIRRISMVDETLQSFGINPKYEQEKKEFRNMILLFLLAIIILLNSGFVIYNNICETGEALIHTFTFFYPQEINILVELTFTILLSILQKRFERLNALLSNAVINSSQMGSYQNIDKYRAILMDNQYPDETIASYYEKNRNNLEYLLPTARQLHLDLCSISRLVNEMMGAQLAMQIAVKFVLLTGYSYAFYLFYQENELPLDTKINYCIFVVIRILYSTTRLCVTIRASENITEEAQRTGQIAQEIEDTRPKILDEIYQFSLQIMHHPLYFTAHGLYVLDFDFIRSFAGSVAFYLIILIQNQPSISHTADEMVADLDSTGISATAL